MNINHESVDYGKIRELRAGEMPSADEIELQVEEAGRLKHLRRVEREAALVQLRASNPIRFHYSQKRKHR